VLANMRRMERRRAFIRLFKHGSQVVKSSITRGIDPDFSVEEPRE